MKKKVVFVGMSGGVDSSVSAAVLQRKGYEVVGVFIRTWHPDFLPCNEEEERRDAIRVAAHLNIPFLTFDFEDVYKKEVADYMIREYRAGRTPNPDVMCNKEVKFGAFLKKSLSMGADFVATGHYAQNLFKDKKFNLAKGIDPLKDQSYFLWTLNQEQISRVIFPVGHLSKLEVRKLAKKFGLPVAEKKDSQGICFLGDVDLKEFLKHYIKEKKGKVLNTEGKVIGHHDGALFYTLGERHGFTITEKSPSDKPHYIVSKDVKKNILIVSQDKNLKDSGAFAIRDKKGKGTHGDKNLSNFSYEIDATNWISKVPESDKRYNAQIRYHGESIPCTIKLSGKMKAKVFFSEPILVASGQSIVLYEGNVCLGGGTVV